MMTHENTHGDIGSDSINAIDCHWVTPQSWDAAIVVTCTTCRDIEFYDMILLCAIIQMNVKYIMRMHTGT